MVRGPVLKRLELNVLEKETLNRKLLDAATVIIASVLSVSERERLTDDLLIGIRKMCERGDTIIAIAIAVALE